MNYFYRAWELYFGQDWNYPARTLHIFYILLWLWNFQKSLYRISIILIFHNINCSWDSQYLDLLRCFIKHHHGSLVFTITDKMNRCIHVYVINLIFLKNWFTNFSNHCVMKNFQTLQPKSKFKLFGKNNFRNLPILIWNKFK